MAPQRLEKIKSAPGNGMGPEASYPQYLVPGARLTARLRVTSCEKESCPTPDLPADLVSHPARASTNAASAQSRHAASWRGETEREIFRLATP